MYKCLTKGRSFSRVLYHLFPAISNACLRLTIDFVQFKPTYFNLSRDVLSENKRGQLDLLTYKVLDIVFAKAKVDSMLR